MDERLAAAQTLKFAEDLGELYRSERRQRELAEHALDQLQRSYRITVRALAAALELRDDDTGAHAERVTELALRLTERVAPRLAVDPQLEYGFLVHDLGKIGVPDAVLQKPGPLDPHELEVMRAHVTLGEQLVSAIPYLGGVALEVVAAHHERWDGRGYPRGLSGDEIPLAARIFSVADAFDAITHDRPYRRAASHTHALAELDHAAGRQLDPEVVEVFFSISDGLVQQAA
jgi:ribonuclease P protein subunit RPR2